MSKTTSKKTFGWLLAVVLVAGISSSGCYGPFKAWHRVHHWNGQVSSNKWAQEGMFLVLNIIPVYGLAMLGDALIFNSVEFWGGKNWIGDCQGDCCKKPAAAPEKKM